MQAPFMYAICNPDGSAWLDENCVAGTAEELKPVLSDLRRDTGDGFCIVPLYTAPPSPVVNPEFTGATAVPTFEEWLSTQENKPLGWVRDSMKESYDACRAAMLAQPVRRGCTVVPLGWIDCAFRVPDTDGNYWGWWSESKRQGPVWFIKSDVQAQFQSSEITHWMPLPAAPYSV